MIHMQRILNVFVLVFLACNINAQTVVQERVLKLFPDAKLETFDVKHHYSESYEIMIDQWLDHDDHSKGTFKQRLFLSHVDRKLPMLFVTEGYGAGPRYYELSDLLQSNQLIVEYRFFGKSVPDSIDYKYLTNEQAMQDLHRIRKAFGKIYRKEWISTGISKGGTTCMYYKATYPRDVKVAIPYVAPLPNAREDKRCDDLIASVGTEECRNKLFDFQRHALSIQDSLLSYAKADATSNGMTFNRIDGIKKAIEYAILEYPFSFWQMGYVCDAVPSEPDPRTCYNHLKMVVGIAFYSDGVISYYEPSFYQFMTKNGYYGFMHDHLDGLIKHVKVFDNSIFAPRGVSLDYDPSYNEWVKSRLDKKGKRMIYIQGEYDPWGACTYIPPVGKDAMLMILDKGSHRTRMASYPEDQQEMMKKALDRWLKAPLKSSEKKS